MEGLNLGSDGISKLRFNREYTEYWKTSVSNSIDGTQIAGTKEVEFYLQMMKIQSGDKILDLGCSYGRFLEKLITKTSNVYGLEPDNFAISEARKLNYIEVVEGIAEETPFQDSYFDQVFAWAVFDIVNLVQTLVEMNRILKYAGTILFTGKNSQYNFNDSLAFKAEKNAYLKNFPNNFTKLPILVHNLHKFGFEVNKIFIFRNRGDFGENIHFEITEDISIPDEFYEYLLILNKTDSVNCDPQIENIFTNEFSDTAIELANKANFSNVHDFFVHLGIS